MKNLQRILSLLLALTLLPKLPFLARAEEDAGIGLSMTVSQPSVLVGETVTLTLQADRDFSSRGSGMTIYYDDSVLELDASASSAAAPLAIHGPLKVLGKSAFRVSFLPGVVAADFSGEEFLAQLRFKALAMTERTEFTMGTAFFYDEALAEIPVTMAESVSVTVEPSVEIIPVTGIALDRTAITMEEGETMPLRATITPSGASDPTVIWISSDEQVAKATGGFIKALGAGQAVITATTRDGGYQASCTVTVKEPDAGYTVEIPGNATAAMGKTIQIPVLISNTDSQCGFNAFDIRFNYDPNVLELVTTQIPNMTVTVSGGEITVLSYGEIWEAGSVPFALEFKVKAAETTQIRILEAHVDNSGNAVVKNASVATLNNDRTEIAAAGYPASLPDDFAGAETAIPGTDYTFTEPDDYYDYTVTVTVDGEVVPVTDNGDGTYTVPADQVTGEIVVTAIKTGKLYGVILGTDMDGEQTTQYGVDYKATIKKNASYRYTISVTIGGKKYTGYTASGGTYTIPGGDITGDIVFKVTKKKITGSSTTGTVKQHAVTFSGSGAGAAEGNATSIANGSTYILTLQKELGYGYRVSYKLGSGYEVELQSRADGTYAITNVNADLEIIIEKTLGGDISVHEYLALDKKTVYLILSKAELDNGSVLAYKDTAMCYSEPYDAWAILVITDEELDAEKVQPLLTTVSQTKRVLAHSGGDVDQNNVIDIQDLQLVHDLYAAKYDTFDLVSMIKFLNADINADKKADIRDAAAVVQAMLER